MRLTRYFLQAYPGRSTLMILCMVGSGVAESASLVTLLPLLQMLMDGSGAAGSTAFELVNSVLGYFGAKPSLGALLGIIVSGIMIKSLLVFLANIQIGFTVAYVSTSMRLALVESLMAAKWSYFVRQPVGVFSNAITSEVGRVSSAFQHSALLVASLIQATFYLATAMVVSWAVSLAAILLGIAAVTALRGLISMSRASGEQQTGLLKSLNQRLVDALNCIKPIKAMGLGSHFSAMLNSEVRSLNVALQRQTIASSAMQSAQEPFVVLVIAAGIFVAVSYWDQAVSSLLVTAFVFHRLTGKLFVSQLCYQEISTQESAFVSLKERIDDAIRHAEPIRGERSPTLANGIHLDRVCFGYTHDRLILNELSLEIPAGKITVIVGPSGIGKTTIVDLIVGLNQATSGSVKLDDVLIEDVKLDDWRSQLGYVPQETVLFHDTLHDNLTLGDPDISLDDLNAALVMAEANEFVARLPQGFATILGERGSTLSGGQRQRIAIARALARKPKLLILDEVTTSLDAKTESEICQTLEKLKGHLTILAISHQTAILDVADVIYELNGNGITRSGEK
jgi:ATP-binding cassette subfamily C protein